MNKRDIILNKAYELFCEKGYALSLSEVTCAAGLQKQSTYNYFKSKDELIKVMLMNEIETFYTAIEAVQEKMRGEPVQERLTAMMKFLVDYYMDVHKIKFRRWIMLLQHQEGMSEITVHFYQAEKNFNQTIRQDISEAVKTGIIKSENEELSMHFLMVYMRGIVESFMIRGDDDLYMEMRYELIDEYWRIVSK